MSPQFRVLVDPSSQAFKAVLNTKPSRQFSHDWSSEHETQFLIQGRQFDPDLNEPGTHLKQIPPSNKILKSSQTHYPFFNVLFSPQFWTTVVDWFSQILDVELKVNPSRHCAQDWSSKQERQFLRQGIQLDPDLNEPGTHLKQIPPSSKILESSHTHWPSLNVWFYPQFWGVITVVDYSSQEFESALKIKFERHYWHDFSSKHEIQFLMQGTQFVPDLKEPGTHLKQIPPSNNMLESSQTHWPSFNVWFSPQFWFVVVVDLF